ncbi:hypothetical protein [Paraburkholderia sp. HD33-4]|uniref:hypothetical protein n=1 Tax=Paraburkholderia sp. HD33-4 TaxID=2883242 RepID=UPI001F3FC139|nr:hypothetical protein [Paraburkholderia sp. HD33-4]
MAKVSFIHWLKVFRVGVSVHGRDLLRGGLSPAAVISLSSSSWDIHDVPPPLVTTLETYSALIFNRAVTTQGKLDLNSRRRARNPQR